MDKKVSQLTELLKAGVADGDLFVVVNAGESKKIQKSTIFSLIIDLITATTTAFKTSFGVIAVYASNNLTTNIGLDYVNIKMVDTLQLDNSNGHIIYDFLTNKATIKTDGLYRFNVFGGAQIPQNVLVTFAWYVNNAPVAVSSPVEYIGAGNTPIHLIGGMLLELNVNDVLEIRAKADSLNTDVTIVAAQFTLEKKHHQ